MDINDIKQTKFFVSHVWPGMIDVKCSKCGKLAATLQNRDVELIGKKVYISKKDVSCSSCGETIPAGMLIAESEQCFDELIIDNGTLAMKTEMGLIYNLKGCRGRSLRVYENKCVFKVDVTFGSILTSNATDGEKTIYYSDVIGVQFKPSGLAIGYLQLETASSSGNNKASNFFNENSFTYEPQNITNEEMEKVVAYIRERIEECKNAKNNPIVAAPAAAVSVADEIKKFKELLDMGAITQEEFDAKKKQLLGL